MLNQYKNYRNTTLQYYVGYHINKSKHSFRFNSHYSFEYALLLKVHIMYKAVIYIILKLHVYFTFLNTGSSKFRLIIPLKWVQFL